MLLVRGYAATESVRTPLRRALAEARFGHIVSLACNSFATDPVAVSATFADPMAPTGAGRELMAA